MHAARRRPSVVSARARPSGCARLGEVGVCGVALRGLRRDFAHNSRARATAVRCRVPARNSNSEFELAISNSAAAASAGNGTGGGAQTSPCAQFCAAEAATCINSNQQYGDTPTCLANCAGYALGTVGDTLGDTLACRVYHVGAAACSAPGSAATHCPHTGLHPTAFCVAGN